MSFKRALVVDDSRSARVSLKRLLEEQELILDLAESGEQALDYLNDHWVDVIFMDHTMPGMDGLEAVSVIKSNPRTAMIPVMMYTTQEGEVYVSQARALGAVDVLPKAVQPGVLFEMLLKLGLVSERRTSDRPVDDTSEQQTSETSVQALVSRILEDQHLKLRSDILQSQRDFARQVVTAVLNSRTHEESGSVDTEHRPQPANQPRLRGRLSPNNGCYRRNQRVPIFGRPWTPSASKPGSATSSSWAQCNGH